MHILWLHQYFATPSGWGSVRTYEFGRRFVAAGHKVEVLCCAAYDPTLVGKGILDAAGMRVHVSSTRYRPQMGFWRGLVRSCPLPALPCGMYCGMAGNMI